MATRGTSLAAAFMWAIGMAAGFGINEGLIHREKTDQVAYDAGLSALVAAVVGYNERRRSPS